MEFEELKIDGNSLFAWKLITDFIVPCTEEEQRIYGVKYRRLKSMYKECALEMMIYQNRFEDGETFYSVFIDCYPRKYFKKLEAAKEFLIKQYQGEQTITV